MCGEVVMLVGHTVVTMVEVVYVETVIFPISKLSHSSFFKFFFYWFELASDAYGHQMVFPTSRIVLSTVLLKSPSCRALRPDSEVDEKLGKFCFKLQFFPLFTSVWLEQKNHWVNYAAQ